ncbi:hypothetical protein I6N95_17550 [Vagococcus sp. BWB3-3]|uniref:Alternate signal-mediated exported protein, CPF_0494 family n=1 Tax=Vagococcus allomyrinae TaxID=2794353 RepID=A0A940SW03_9ENTE|nr:hypothetical protein [Vagococcus allomyrinae]MBP1042825.1 hypothetical protein [Vagococcus allomyrinae]
MKKAKNKKKLLAVGAALSLCVLMLGTFAWDVYQTSKENKFGNAVLGGSIVIEEIFPDPVLTPGAELQKEVWGVNTSQNDVFIRMSFEERLALLVEEGATGQAEKQYLTDPTLATAKEIPVVMDAIYLDGLAAANTAGTEFDDWKDITAKLPVGTVTADTKVLAKATKKDITPPGGTATWQVSVEYTAYRKVPVANTNMGEVSRDKVVKYPNDAASVAQEVVFETDASGKVTTISATVNPATGDITGYTADVGKPAKYSFYTGLDTDEFYNWAGPVVHAGLTTDPLIPLANIDRSAIDPLISLKYGADLDTTAAANTWIYNEDDGYFYWIGIVSSGDKTKNLLEKVGLASSASSMYDYLDYSLWITADGVLTKEAAIVEQFFKGTVPAGGTSKTVYDALVGLIP